ncbi:hypothetical protein Ancab_033544 [Ancistrocladus abbreviatus]
MYESLHDKTWRFSRDGLFPSHSSQDDDDDDEFEYFYTSHGDSDKAFRVIEVEVKFLYDYFYTKCYVGQYHALKTDVTFTWIAVLAKIGLELPQTGILLSPDWCKVIWVYIYVRKQLWRNKFIEKVNEIACRARW